MLIRFRYTVGLSLLALYGVELLDELIYGLGGAVLPSIKTELELSYTQIGLLLTLPGVVALAGEPLIGLLGDTHLRRALVVGGCVATGIGLWLTGIAHEWSLLLAAWCILFIASGAYVNLAQATLIDRDPLRAEQTMARWTVLGSVGVSVAPALVTALLASGYGWRGLYLGLAGTAGIYALVLSRQEFSHFSSDLPGAVSLSSLARDLVAAFQNHELIRWLILTEVADLMLDKLTEVIGIYFHDVVRVTTAEASAAVALHAGAALAGDLLVLPLLEKVSGTRVLRVTAVVTLVLYAAFLLVPSVALRFVLVGALGFSTAGWYAVLRGRTYAALPGQSGLVVAATSLANVVSLFAPLAVGSAADLFGLQSAMWLLALGPLALMVGLPRNEK